MQKKRLRRLFTIVAISLLILSTAHQSSNSANIKSHISLTQTAEKKFHHLQKSTSTMYLLTGHFDYWNTKLGEWLPLAFAQVGIYDSSSGVTRTTWTDIYGNFTFQIDVPPGTMIEYYIYTVNNYAYSDQIKLMKPTSDESYLYSYGPIPIEQGNVTRQFGLEYSYEINDAFTAFSYQTGLNRAWYFIKNTTGTYVIGAKARYPLSGIPSYDITTREIHLPQFTKGYPDTICHEYAHYAMHWAFYQSLGGWHWPSNATGDYEIEKVSNSNKAWVEGWGLYLPLAVKDNGTYVMRAYGCDEVIDFETPHWCYPDWDDGDSVVGRVTGALFDIYDSTNDGYDPFSDGFNRTWNVLLFQPYNGEPCNNFSLFWKIWNVTYYTHPKSPSSPYNQQDWTNTLMAIFQNSIDYRGTGDVDANGMVDMVDLYLIQVHFGYYKQYRPYEWDQRRDLDYNDKIDMVDMWIAARNYGKTYDC